LITERHPTPLRPVLCRRTVRQLRPCGGSGGSRRQHVHPCYAVLRCGVAPGTWSRRGCRCRCRRRSGRPGQLRRRAGQAFPAGGGSRKRARAAPAGPHEWTHLGRDSFEAEQYSAGSPVSQTGDPADHIGATRFRQLQTPSAARKPHRHSNWRIRSRALTQVSPTVRTPSNYEALTWH
jgi:hypothetical protein